MAAAFAGRYRYVEFDMLAGDWSALDGLRLDAVVSTLGSSLVDHERRV